MSWGVNSKPDAFAKSLRSPSVKNLALFVFFAIMYKYLMERKQWRVPQCSMGRAEDLLGMTNVQKVQTRASSLYLIRQFPGIKTLLTKSSHHHPAS